MKIARVEAWPIAIPYREAIVGLKEPLRVNMCFVRMETDDGLVGHGVTGITSSVAVAHVINSVAGPAVTGLDPVHNELIWDRLYWAMVSRGQTGFAIHAIAAIDVAIWDIKAKALGLPLWRLLGGARDRVETYATFGLPDYDRDQLVEAARWWISRGYTRLKMELAHGLPHRDERSLLETIREDAERVRVLREGIGDDVEICVDGHCSLDPYHAYRFSRMIEPYGIAFYEEPTTQNDARLLADLRRRVGIPISAGQNEGLSSRYRDLLMHEAVDILQPNVVIGGGFTQALKVAGMAQAFNIPICNGGAWPHHNMHLQAGVANGTMIEYHYPVVEASRLIYKALPEAERGWMTMPQTPGLGFEPDFDAVREFSIR